MLLYMDGALYIYIEEGTLVVIPDPLEFRLKCTIVFAFVYHFPFHKFIVLDLLLKVFFGKEVIIFSVLFIVPGGTRSCRNGECKLRQRMQKITRDGGLPCPGWSGNYDDFVLDRKSVV